VETSFSGSFTKPETVMVMLRTVMFSASILPPGASGGGGVGGDGGGSRGDG